MITAEHALDGGDIAWRLGVAVLVIAVNAFFVAAESALTGARHMRIRSLARAGNVRARRAESALQNLDRSVAGARIGTTLATVALGWLGASTLAGLALPFVASPVIAAALIFLILVFVHVGFGVLAPRSMALVSPESAALWTAGPLLVFVRAIAPVIAVVRAAAGVLPRLLGVRAAHRDDRVHRPEELELLLTQSFEHGLLSEQPVEMIRGVFGLSATTAAEVMTPRTAVVAIPVEYTVAEAAAFILQQGHSRYPVFEESLDHVVGMVLARDVWQAQMQGVAELRSIMRAPLFVPDSKRVETLLLEMRQAGAHLGVVIDEFGGTAGVVTIEDVVEEVVGEIVDELDEAPLELVHGPDGEVLIGGAFAIGQLNELYGLRLPDEDYTTVGGFVLGRLGRVAQVGDEVEIRGGTLRVLTMEGRRIGRLALLLRSHTSAEAAALEHTDEDWE